VPSRTRLDLALRCFQECSGLKRICLNGDLNGQIFGPVYDEPDVKSVEIIDEYLAGPYHFIPKEGKPIEDGEYGEGVTWAKGWPRVTMLPVEDCYPRKVRFDDQGYPLP
jgi:hypothetical protein